jgi:hypothetical protein
MKDMGRVMGEASKEMAGQADGKVIAAVVKSLLSCNLKCKSLQLRALLISPAVYDTGHIFKPLS